MKIIIAIKIGFCFFVLMVSLGQGKAQPLKQQQILPAISPFEDTLLAIKKEMIDTTILQTDSLENVVIRAFEQNRNLLQTAAAVGLITQRQMLAFGNASLLPALNLLPGVKMEERSPGSFRLNIRGSSLRSPFGVRNVKVYINDLIFTDPGGGTYVNQLGFYNVAGVTVLKGPAASIYGAGTGGALLLQTKPLLWQPGVECHVATGSFGMKQLQAKARWGNALQQNTLSFQHQSADGYRQQSALRRNVATYEASLQINKQQKLSLLAFYSNLYYQTPGGLTVAQYMANPKLARPRVGTQPSAQEAKAAIYQKTFYAGIANQIEINTYWRNTTSVYGAFTNFNNPGIRVYEKRTEPHFGGRSVFTHQIIWGEKKLQIVYGAEAQKGIFSVSTFKNNNGFSDSLQTNDEVNNWRYTAFAQAELLCKKGWILSAGASFNKSNVEINRLNAYPNNPQQRTFGNIVSPRISILKSFNVFSIYGIVSQGFSPPTTSELLPSNGSINRSLEAEKGINYELGSRGSLWGKKWQYDASLYLFFLKDAISQRRDVNGNDFFVNTGGTKQQGIELLLTYQPITDATTFVSNLMFTGSYNFQHFTYKNYKVLMADYTGKQLPGVAKNYFTLGANATTKAGIGIKANYHYTHKIWLNDANSEYAPSYFLMSLRLDYPLHFKQHYVLEFFAFCDNLTGVTYSLGNDINAAAGRYYNAAGGRNYTMGVAFKWLK